MLPNVDRFNSIIFALFQLGWIIVHDSKSAYGEEYSGPNDPPPQRKCSSTKYLLDKVPLQYEKRSHELAAGKSEKKWTQCLQNLMCVVRSLRTDE